LGIGIATTGTATEKLLVNGTIRSLGQLVTDDTLSVSSRSSLWGNVAIGAQSQQSSSYKLDVVGNVNISTGITYSIDGALLSYNNLNNKLIAGTGINIDANNPITATGTTCISATDLIDKFSSDFTLVDNKISATKPLGYYSILIKDKQITVKQSTNPDDHFASAFTFVYCDRVGNGS
jgi:hypothetical protein